MCGIAGFSTFRKDLDGKEQIIKRMCDAISHRGPDEEGFYDTSKVVLGHRRLSIVGLDDGTQPIISKDKRFSIVFNGEIYNYKALRQDLEKEGFKFVTGTDTEVVLYLYMKHGTDSFKYLNGMFAIAIWDEKEKELILARDRMGKKPLFYFYKDNEIIFSSELKSLVKHPSFVKKLSLKGMNKFFTYEYIPAPYTIFEDTWKVEAGEVLVVKDNSIKKEFFWEYPNVELEGESINNEDDAIASIDSILRNSVNIRLQADVPVGVLLSGGLDSSLISAIAAQENKSKEKIKSFSIYFNEESYDESDYIKQMVKHLDLDHSYEVVSSKDMLSIFDNLGSIMDEPMADPSIVPTYYLSKLASSKVKTVLGGDGADELFAGYPTYIANKLVNIYNIIPYPIRKPIAKLISQHKFPVLPMSTKNMSIDFKLRQFLRGTGVASEVRFFRWMAGFLEQEKREIYSEDVQHGLLGDLAYEDLNRFLSRANFFGELNRLLYLSQKMYLTNDILVKVDRASMMNSLEVRAPFLDYRLVEYVSTLPERFKLKGFKTKYILKKVAEKYLPKKIIYRAKHGFGIPIADWLCDGLKEPVLDLLSKDNIERQGLFNYESIKTLVDDHINKKVNNRKLLWTLLSFQLWEKEFQL